MKTIKYKEIAESIRIKLMDLSEKEEILSEDNWNIVYSPDNEIYSLKREFIHLVYSFDKNLPLNKELEQTESSLDNLGVEWGHYRKTIIMNFVDKIDFFIHYLITYTGIDDEIDI